MSASDFSALSYQSQDRQVSWHGNSVIDNEAFNEFMTNDVASRLHDEEGAADFEAHLLGLAGTGFARDSLDSILAAAEPEGRDWAIGESLAEAYLSCECAISWPWNMSRDKRNPNASLPGADLVGFEINGSNIRLALGEVKTSSDTNSPPGVMHGRSGMTHQIDGLANNLSLIHQLLLWLFPRCKGTKHQVSFDKAIGLFLASGNKAISLFGVLIRDTQPSESDLKSRATALAGTLRDPTTCQLIGIYLPFAITDLPTRVSAGGS